MLSKSRLLLGVFGLFIVAGSSSFAAGPTSAADFNGDGKKDLTVYDRDDYKWYSINVDTNDISLFGDVWGFSGTVPLAGDMDNVAGPEMVAYNPVNGTWYIRSLPGTPQWTENWGFLGTIPLLGNFDGTNGLDMAAYDTNTGNWYLRTLAGATIGAQPVNWGYSGVVPLVGDLNNDGTADLFVYDPNTFNWHISQVSGGPLKIGFNFGFAGAEPFVLDYDNDGFSDLGVYNPATGRWFIFSVELNTVLAWNLNFGFPGGIATVGDFGHDDGDDIAVYNPFTGRWFIRAQDGTIIAWNLQWGFPTAEPFATIDVALHKPILTGGNGFLYKPSTTLILLPPDMRPGGGNPVSKVVFSRDPAGKDVFRTLTYTGNFGARPKWRFTGGQGCSYGKRFYAVAFFKNGGLPQPWLIFDGCHRQS